MNIKFVFRLIVYILGTLITLGSSETVLANDLSVHENAKTRIQKSYGKLPLYFIQNEGQVDSRVRFYEKGKGRTTYFCEDGVYLLLLEQSSNNDRQLPTANVSKENISGISTKLKVSNKRSHKSQLIKLQPIGANKNPEVIAEDRQMGKVNYFIGNDKKKWRTNIPTYTSVRYKEVYDGIDMRFYGNKSQLEYDIIVQPGADPAKVWFAYEGIEGLKIKENGDLDILLMDGSLTQKTPYVYQEIDGKRIEVKGRFKVKDNTSILSRRDLTDKHQQFAYGFKIASYNKNHPLIIDPVLVYSTYLGGNSTDSGENIVVDAEGNAYITGTTSSSDFPTFNPFQPVGLGGDAFVTKLDPTGISLVYSTFLGGNDSDIARSIDIDSQGNTYITGHTRSTDFPTVNPIKANQEGLTDAFLTKLDASGTMLSYSTYIGGSRRDEGEGIAVDKAGNAYITGHTTSIDFPTVNAFMPDFSGNGDAFIVKVDASGTHFSYATYLGGSNGEQGQDIAVDHLGNAYLTGITLSNDFPTFHPYQEILKGYSDGFVTKFDTSGTRLVYSTYLGGTSEDFGNGVTIDTAGNAYVTGGTSSSDFPTVNPIQPIHAGEFDAFVTKINHSGDQLVYSTYLGGNDTDWGEAIAVDVAGNAYIAGGTFSVDFPVVDPIQNFGGGDAYVTKINASGTELVYSSSLHGNGYDKAFSIAVDLRANAYITGFTTSNDFISFNAFQTNHGGGIFDAFITKIAGPLETIDTFILSDASWKSFDELQMGWESPGFDDSEWRNAFAPYPFAQVSPPDSIIPDTNAVFMWDYPDYPPVLPDGRDGPRRAWLRKRFNLPAKPENIVTATLTAGADDDFDFFVNGIQVLSDHDGDVFTAPFTVDIKPYLQDGNNVFAMHAIDYFANEWALVEAKISVSHLLGDLNNSGCVDRTDYQILISDLRDGPPNNPEYDLNEDGVINIADARYLASLFTNPRGRPCQFTVTKTEDTADGRCDADCSLREAIIAANATPEENVIIVPPGTYELTIPNAVVFEEDAAATGDLDITNDLIINGTSPSNTIIDGSDRYRLFHVIGNAKVSINHMILQHGRKRGTGGAGIFNEGGTLEIDNVVIQHGGSVDDGGGGIRNVDGVLRVSNSTITNNTAFEGGGGGIYNNIGGSVTLINSTITKNSALDVPIGGGILNFGSELILINSLITDNTPDDCYGAGCP